jgi:S-adenosylmethionine hydrolase
MQAPCGLVTLLTDFGLGDPFVGVMKGVLFGAHPELRVIDLTHGIGHGAVVEGAFWLERSYRYFPQGSVHCAVVDPGVGSERGAVVVGGGEKIRDRVPGHLTDPAVIPLISCFWPAR